MLTSRRCLMPSGLMQLIMASVTKDQVGRVHDVSRYFFNQVTSMARFLASMSRRSIPPLLLGLYSHFRLRGGFFRSHRKSRVSLVSAFRTDLGMPWAVVRNCVITPTVICRMSRLASSVGLLEFQLSRVSFILSMIGFQGCVASVLFPIQAPRHLMAWLLLEILISSCRGGSSGWRRLVEITEL